MAVSKTRRLLLNLQRLWPLFGGSLLTVLAILGMLAVEQTAFVIPNPPAFLIIAVLYAVFSGGVRSGLFSALIALLYIALFYSIPGQPYQYTDEGMRRIIGWFISISAIVFLVSILKKRADQAAARVLAQEREHGALLEQALIERRRAEESLLHILVNVRCLLWDAVVVERDGQLDWDIQIKNTEAAQRFLPLIVPPGKTYTEVWRESRFPEDRARMRKYGNEALRSGQSGYTQEFRCYRGDGSLCWLFEAVQIEPLEPDRWRLVGVCTDITARKQAEADLRGEHDLLEGIMKTTVTPMIVADPDGSLLFANDAAGQLFGITTREITTRAYNSPEWRITDVDGSPLADEHMPFQKVLSAGIPVNGMEHGLIHPNGEHRILSISGAPIKNAAGDIKTLVFSISDITERRRTEAQIKTALIEKEVLLREIHHRVKNNLQIISSLLKLQSTFVADPATRTLFNESRNRVRTMALVHEQLYQSGDLSRIDFAAYTRKLSANLFRSSSIGTQSVQLRVEVDHILLDVDTAAACGLIINELVTNSLKYAFPVGQTGEISICASPDSQGCVTLVVGDTGVGLPPEFDVHTHDSLGLKLVYTLTSQLEGTATYQFERGTTWTITFPISRPEPMQ